MIFGGGELKDIRFTQSLLREDDYIVCADRGYAYCADGAKAGPDSGRL